MKIAPRCKGHEYQIKKLISILTVRRHCGRAPVHNSININNVSSRSEKGTIMQDMINPTSRALEPDESKGSRRGSEGSYGRGGAAAKSSC